MYPALLAAILAAAIGFSAATLPEQLKASLDLHICPIPASLCPKALVVENRQTIGIDEQKANESNAGTAQHTLGHRSCPGCEDNRKRRMQIALTPSLTTAEALQQFIRSRELPGHRARRNAPRTIEDYDQYARALNRMFGSMELAEIHAGHLETYQNDRAGGVLAPSLCGIQLAAGSCTRWGKHRGKCSVRPQAHDMEVGSRKINQELGLLKRVMLRAGAWTPEHEEMYEPLLPAMSDIPRALTPEEQERWLSSAERISDVVYWYSIIAFRTMASNIEMRGLRLGDVNLYQRVLTVQSKHAKNTARIRTIALAEDAVYAIERLKDRDTGCCLPHHYLFPFRIGKGPWLLERPMSTSGLKKPWDAIQVDCNLPSFTPHCARHTAITRYAEAGTPISVIMAMAGHLSPRMTAHYTQISEQAQRQAVDAVVQGRVFQRKPNAGFQQARNSLVAGRI